MASRINWVGIAAGTASLLLILISFFVPWWRFNVGNPSLAEANFSPVNLNFSLFGDPITIPIIWALNLSSLLSLLAGGIIMLIYSVKPHKSYSSKLLGFGWNKPVFAVILFVVELIALVVLVKNIAGFDFPLYGSANIQLPQSMLEGASGSVGVNAAFEWPFYFAIAVAGLSVAARLYHRKIVPQAIKQPN